MSAFPSEGLLMSSEEVEAALHLLPDDGSALSENGSRSSNHDVDGCCCWGESLKALLNAPQQQPCEADFQPGKHHLKNKFCALCRDGVLVPASHVRSLTPELEQLFVNSCSAGLWSRIRVGASDCEVIFRVVNQTKRSRGNALIICRTPPPNLAWAELPKESLWPSSDGDAMRFGVSKGTLVPMAAPHLVPQDGGKHRAANPDEAMSKRRAADADEAMAVPTKRTMHSVGAQASLLAAFLPVGVGLPGTSLTSTTPGTSNGANATLRPSAASFNDTGAAVRQTSLLAAFMPIGLGLTTTSMRASATSDSTETGRLLPSPPMSPPDVTPLGVRSSTGIAAPVVIHPITLRFSCTVTEARWRAAHAGSVLSIAVYLVPVQPAIYLALALGDTNQGCRILLLAWSLGYVPAALMVLALRALHGSPSGATPLPPWVPRAFDWSACSLYVMPQLLVLLLAWQGVADPLDPRDPTSGAKHFGKLFANNFVAHVCIRLNSTHWGPSLIAYTLCTALMLMPLPPISITPAAELALCRQGVLSGLVGGYVLERGLRHSYLRSRTPSVGVPTSPSKVVPTVAGGTRMHPLTRRWSCAVLEDRYRAWLFSGSYSFLGCITAITTAMQLCSYLEGEASLGTSMMLLVSQNAPRLVRFAVHGRGDRAADARRFGVFFLVYEICFLTANLCMSSLGGGGIDGDRSFEAWLFAQPLVLLMQGVDARYNWLLSATALVLSCVCPSRSWSNHEQAALRDAIVAGDIFAYLIDYAMRVRHLEVHGGTAAKGGEVQVEQP